jgi:hypothetical protein
MNYLYSSIVLSVPFSEQTLEITDVDEAKEVADRLLFFFNKEAIKIDSVHLYHHFDNGLDITSPLFEAKTEEVFL